MSEEVLETVCGFRISIKDNFIILTDISTKEREEISGVLGEGEFYLKHEKFNGKRFRSLPVNEFGFKTLLEIPNLVLMVTNNCKVIAYSDGVPSIVGYPSTIPEISGVYFDRCGNRLVPNLSFLTSGKLEEMYLELVDASFTFNQNHVYEKVKDFIVNTLDMKNKGDIKNNIVATLNTESRFINNFSGIKTKKKFLLQYIQLIKAGGNYMIVQETIILEEPASYKEFEMQGSKFIIDDQGGSIKFGPNYSSEYKMLNGYVGYCPLNLLNIAIEDFYSIPTNERGFKTLVEYKNKSIELTATGKIIFYEDGIPSLFGYPSDFNLLSGPVVRDCSVLIPIESALNNYQMNHLVFKQLQESFEATGDELLSPMEGIVTSYEASGTDIIVNPVNLYEFFNGKQPKEIQKKIETLYGFLKISSSSYTKNKYAGVTRYPLPETKGHTFI